MPYEEHPLIPAVETQRKVWRHTDFIKFVSLLEEKALYFSNVKNFQDDPYEGSITDLMRERIQAVPAGQSNLSIIDQLRDIVYVSSWHLHEYESAAMWKQYAGSGFGIAIQSTAQRMMDALNNTPQRIHIGKVNYIDYNLHEIPQMNSILFALYKRLYFRADEELRMIALAPEFSRKEPLINVDLDRLIEKIYLSPESPGWFGELVNKTLKRYGLNKVVLPSEI